MGFNRKGNKLDDFVSILKFKRYNMILSILEEGYIIFEIFEEYT